MDHLSQCSNDTEVGEVIVPLKEVDKLVEDPSEHMLELELKEPKQVSSCHPHPH